jgi:hypothetical protein
MEVTFLANRRRQARIPVSFASRPIYKDHAMAAKQRKACGSNQVEERRELKGRIGAHR